MSMRMLLDGDFDRYFDPVRRRAAFWVFQHVPKTAGSSLRAEIVQGLHEVRPETNIHVDGTDATVPWHDRMDAAVAGFIARMPSSDYRFASGHLFARHIAQVKAAEPCTRVFTFLRDPVQRFISDFRYQRSAMYPGHEAFRRNVPTLEAFLALGWTADSMAGHLLPIRLRQGGDVAAAVDHVLDEFEFVGLQDDYTFSFAVLSCLLGFAHKPTRHERRNPATADNPTDWDRALATRIEEAHRLDRALFQALRRRWMGIRGDLADWLGKQKPTDPLASGPFDPCRAL